MQNRPSEEEPCDQAAREKTAVLETAHSLAGRTAERSEGGFASSPDVLASRPSPRIVNRLQTDYRVECETSGLAACRASPSMLLNKRRTPFGPEQKFTK
jgi:hypothetical protein